MDDRLQRTLQAATTRGVLPAAAVAPEQDHRPWPVLLLMALGAWLAAVPLLIVVGTLLGDLAFKGPGPYLIGVLVLAGAGVVLRSRDVPLFVEQLAVPCLVVGLGSLGFGLFRDFHEAGALVLAAVALGTAAMVPRPWLRVLLGAAAAQLLAMAFIPNRWGNSGAGVMNSLWWGWHAGLAMWVAGAWWLLRGRIDGASSRWAAAWESASAGWLLMTLAGLAWWSGMTFMVGGSLGDGLLREAVTMGAHRRSLSERQAVSVLLAAAGAVWLARCWPGTRRVWLLGVAVVLLVLAWFLPALGAVALALAVCASTQRWRLASAAGVAAAWIVGSFYYQLSWPLQTKAVVLVAAGAVLGGLAWASMRRPVAAGTEQAATPGLALSRHAGIAFTALAVLAVANVGIWQKEDLIAHGRPVYVELAPRDPRSLVQGDYMALNFRLPANVENRLEGLLVPGRPRIVARLDERGVATPLRLDDGTPPGRDELRIELTPKNGRWVLVSDAWFFKEGEAGRWERARYGEFRVNDEGRALLVGLRDAGLQPL